MMNPMNHMATHFPGDMGGYGQHHTGPGPGSPAQQQAHGAGGPVDGMNGFRAMQQQQQQQQQQPAGPNAMFQGPAMESQQQRSMMGSNAHMAGGQVVTNNMMNGSSMALGPGPMNGMMNMQMPPQQQQQQQQSQMGAGGMQQQQHMMQQQPQQHMGVHMDGSNMVGGGGGGPVVGQQQQQGGNGQGVRACAGCGGKILERFLFHALDRFWHHGCLKCSCCGARLADIGVSCYTKAGMILCRADYVRLFGSSGACSACGQGIPANELVMRVGGAGPAGGPGGGGGGGGPNGIHPPSGGGGNAAGGVYHVKCFACTKCQTQLMPGDRYALIGGSLLCEQDCHKMMKNNNNNNNNNNNANNNNHAGPGGGGAGVGGGGGGGGGGVNQPPGAGGPGATGTNASTGGSGGGPVRKGKVGRPRRSRD